MEPIPMDKPANMPFKDAAGYVLTFGKYRGRTLDDVASTDDGLLYLDWLEGTDRPGHNRLDYWTGLALRSYLADTTIARDVEKLAKRRARQ